MTALPVGMPPSAVQQPLPRHRALAKPSAGLWDAIGAWLNSAGRLLAAGFIVKKRRTRLVAAANARSSDPLAAPRDLRRKPLPSLRERTEMIQLQAENRRLREQLAKLNNEPQPAAAGPAAAVPEKAPLSMDV